MVLSRYASCGHRQVVANTRSQTALRDPIYLNHGLKLYATGSGLRMPASRLWLHGRGAQAHTCWLCDAHAYAHGKMSLCRLKRNAKPQAPRVIDILRHSNQSIRLQSSSGAMNASAACTALGAGPGPNADVSHTEKCKQHTTPQCSANLSAYDHTDASMNDLTNVNTSNVNVHRRPTATCECECLPQPTNRK